MSAPMSASGTHKSAKGSSGTRSFAARLTHAHRKLPEPAKATRNSSSSVISISDQARVLGLMFISICSRRTKPQRSLSDVAGST